jgi:hypothetical protein
VRRLDNATVMLHAEEYSCVPVQIRQHQRLFHPYLVNLHCQLRLGPNRWLIVSDAGCSVALSSHLSLEPAHAAQIALALHYLHGRGFMHGSVCKGNVWEAGEAVKLAGSFQTLSHISEDHGEYEGADWNAFGHLLQELFLPNARDPAVLTDLIERLTKGRAGERISYGPGGFQCIKSHPYFGAVSWDSLYESVSRLVRSNSHCESLARRQQPLETDEYDWITQVASSEEDVLMLEQVLKNSSGSLEAKHSA